MENNPETNKAPVKNVEEERRFLQSVFSKMPGTIYIHDLENDVNLCRSLTLVKLLGLKDTPLLKTGKGIRALVHEDDHPKFKEAGGKLED
ncbi:MAG: PAS domain-containing protein, partial [Flavobacteriales bacterium]|nr:PAS domain-containing protein [Flavobacteriales bacterium]